MTGAPSQRCSSSVAAANARVALLGSFPDDRSLIRLAGMLCIEQNDEWLVGRGYLSAESIALCLAEPEKSDIGEIKEEMGELQAA